MYGSSDHQISFHLLNGVPALLWIIVVTIRHCHMSGWKTCDHPWGHLSLLCVATISVTFSIGGGIHPCGCCWPTCLFISPVSCIQHEAGSGNPYWGLFDLAALVSRRPEVHCYLFNFNYPTWSFLLHILRFHSDLHWVLPCHQQWFRVLVKSKSPLVLLSLGPLRWQHISDNKSVCRTLMVVVCVVILHQCGIFCCVIAFLMVIVLVIVQDSHARSERDNWQSSLWEFPTLPFADHSWLWRREQHLK